jgi:hypothetical protein
MIAIALIMIGRVILPNTLPADVQPMHAIFDGNLHLGGYKLRNNADSVELALYWSAAAHNNADYSIFVHVMQEEQRIALDDTRPYDGAYPTWRWFHNDWVVTHHILHLPDAAVRPDTIYAGLYDPSTMTNVALIQDNIAIPDGRAIVWSE